MRKLLLLIIFSKHYAENFTNRDSKNIPVIISYNAFCKYKRYARIVKGLSEKEFECSLINIAKRDIIQGKSYGNKNINESILNL